MEKIFDEKGVYIYRLKVKGGWLVFSTGQSQGLTYIPDETHTWDGSIKEGGPVNE